MDNKLEAAIAQRDEILKAMDVDRAKGFILATGGTVPKRALDWTVILHLARHEVTTMPEDLHMESKVALARSGKYGIASLSPKSPYLLAAMDLIFPKTLTDADIKATKDATLAEVIADERHPAEVFDPREFVRDEMALRGMTDKGVGATVRSWMAAADAPMTNKVSQALSVLFSTSQDYWRNLDAAYQQRSGGEA